MFLRFLDHLEEWVIAFLMGGATLITFAAVVHGYASKVDFLYPYAFRINMTWAQEICIYMFVWMAKFGAAYGVRTGIHVGVDVLVNKLPDAWRNKSILFGLLAGAFFTAVVGTMGAEYVWAMAHTTETAEVSEIPSWIVYLAIPCGSYLMCFRFLQVAIKFFRTHELPHFDHGYVEGLDETDAEKLIATGAAK